MIGNINIRTQKVYTYPGRELYGEFCVYGLAELRKKLISGELAPESLCFIDSFNRAYPLYAVGNTDTYCSEFLHEQYMDLLSDNLKSISNKRLIQ